ncbi:MAG: hypothetical protein ACI4PF_00255 [Christensenellales bacterium]
MIKEFWQERKEEKKRQKQLKKELRKSPKTKEQIAYKVFGVLFAIFLIFGSIGYACNNVGTLDDYSWESVVGISDEMINALTEPVDRNLILTENVLSSYDWQMAQEELLDNCINIVKNGEIDGELLNENNYISSNVTFEMMSLGAIIYQFIEGLGSGDRVELLSFKLYEDNEQLYLKSVCFLDLSAIVSGSKLPVVYVTTISRITLINNRVSSLNPSIQLNLIEKQMNDDIVNTINNSSFLDISYYTNTQVINQINNFASLIGANIEISGNNFIFIPKN